MVTTILCWRFMRSTRARQVEELSINTVRKSGRWGRAMAAVASFQGAFTSCRTKMDTSSDPSAYTAPPWVRLSSPMRCMSFRSRRTVASLTYSSLLKSATLARLCNFKWSRILSKRSFVCIRIPPDNLCIL